VHPDLSREGPRFEPVCSHRIKKGHPPKANGFFMYTSEVFRALITLNQLTSSVDLVHPDLSREGPRFEPVCSHRLKKGHSLHVDGFFMHLGVFRLIITLHQLISSVDLVHPDLRREGPRFEPVCSHKKDVLNY